MLPRVMIFSAVSADGRIDCPTVDVGLFYELAARYPTDAILAGSETLLAASGEMADDPAEAEERTVDPADTRPLVAIVDGRGRVRNWHYWRSQPYWRDALALCSQSTPAEHLDYLRTRSVETIVVGEERVDLRAALAELSARYGVRSVRVESGGTLNGALLRLGLVDEFDLLISPSLVGGTSQRSVYRAPDLTSPDGVIPLRLLGVDMLRGDHLWLRYEVVR